MSGHLKGKCSTSSYRGWSYNLRACQYSSDEDSEDEGSAVTKTSLKAVETLPDDVKLLRDLDISSRHDDAVFKPNPWTIAKVNAASRQKKPSSGPTSQPSKPSISRPEPSRHGKPIKTSGKQQSLSLTLTKIDPPHDSPVPPVVFVETSLSPRVDVGSHVNQAALKSDGRTATLSFRPTPTEPPLRSPSHKPILLTVSDHTNDSISSDTSIYAPPTSWKASQINHSSQTPNTPLRSGVRIQGRSPSTSMSVKKSVRQNSMSPKLIHIPLTPSSIHSSSKIVHLPNDAHSQLSCSPFIDASAPIHQGTKVSETAADGEPPVHNEHPSYPGKRERSSSEFQESRHSAAPSLCSSGGLPFGETSRSPIIQPLRLSQTAHTYDQHQIAPTLAVSFPITNDLLAAQDIISTKRRFQSSVPIPSPTITRHGDMRLQDVSSRPAHTRSPGPRILPSPQKPTKRDAYTAFGSPPDSSWSTLPTKTGRSKTKVGATRVKTSGGFRLPGLVNRNVRTKMPRDSDEERRVSSTQKRRVVTYLPPPRTNVANTNAAPRELESASTSADVCGNSHGDVVAGPPSSPLGPSATPPSFRQGLKAQRQASPLSQRSSRHISYKEARASLPSPPRSDPPVPGSSPVGLEYWSRSPVQTHFDMGRLQRGYAGTRKKIAEVCIADALFVDFHPF